MTQVISFILHIDKYLVDIINYFSGWAYAIIFLIVFAETGFVVTPFLPGDSLIFAIGAISVKGGFNIFIAYIVLLVAAILGDGMNYWLGKHVGQRVFKKIPFFSDEDLEKTQHFYEKHGGKTIILARFLPIIRTFAPFVAGIGKMNYFKFASYNVVGAFLWVTAFLFLGYFFGNIPVIEKNFSLVIIGIIFVSLIPAVYEFLRKKIKK